METCSYSHLNFLNSSISFYPLGSKKGALPLSESLLFSLLFNSNNYCKKKKIKKGFGGGDNIPCTGSWKHHWDVALIPPRDMAEISLCSSLLLGTLAVQTWDKPSAAVKYLLQSTSVTARILMQIQTNSNWMNFLNQELRLQRTWTMWLCGLFLS